MKEFSFTDNSGDSWKVKVHAATLGKIEDALDVKFADMSDDQGPLMRIMNDYMFCFRCLFVVCEPQCNAKGIGSEEFSELIVGDAFTLAQDALINAVIAFFPNAERREAAHELVGQMRSAEVLLTRKARAELKKLDMDKITDDMIGAKAEE